MNEKMKRDALIDKQAENLDKQVRNERIIREKLKEHHKREEVRQQSLEKQRKLIVHKSEHKR